MNHKLRPVMLAGTGSDVGKSVLATALCRIFLQDGYHPAPFKAQNMALNSFATPEGYEIGRAQAVQAEAAGIPCHTDMNPLLLKPQADHTSQVILNGRPIGQRDAYDYFRPSEQHDRLRAEVCAAFDRLAARHNPIVMEGAGSICELNLMDTDLVNMPMARYADARVVLVADIDRGGVFASAYGSIMLQSPEDRARICGIIVNKFRGNLRLFDEGRRILQRICGVPVLGVVPAFTDIHVDGEDSVALERKRKHGQTVTTKPEWQVAAAVVQLPHISNYTDFDRLENDPRLRLFYTDQPSELTRADIILLPGTKTTLDDLRWLQANGCAAAIQEAHRRGAVVVGICGGYQMMGRLVEDPQGIEGKSTCLAGLGLLPTRTVMTEQKVTLQRSFRLAEGGRTLCKGYEIHQGRTESFGTCAPVAVMEDGTEEGTRMDERTWGTYLHGFFDNDEAVELLLLPFDSRLAPNSESLSIPDYQEWKNQQYDRLADHVRRYIDLQCLYRLLQE